MTTNHANRRTNKSFAGIIGVFSDILCKFYRINIKTNTLTNTFSKNSASASENDGDNGGKIIVFKGIFLCDSKIVPLLLNLKCFIIKRHPLLGQNSAHRLL